MTHISNVLVSTARFCNPHFSAILEIPPEIPGWKQIILSKTEKEKKSLEYSCVSDVKWLCYTISFECVSVIYK